MADVRDVKSEPEKQQQVKIDHNNADTISAAMLIQIAQDQKRIIELLEKIADG